MVGFFQIYSITKSMGFHFVVLEVQHTYRLESGTFSENWLLFLKCLSWEAVREDPAINMNFLLLTFVRISWQLLNTEFVEVSRLEAVPTNEDCIGLHFYSQMKLMSPNLTY